MNVKLVFIDDEQDILNILRLKLRKLQKVDGVDVVLLESAKEFEEFITNDQSEVVSVISDINMPDNNVLDVLKNNTEKYRFVLTYLCSAYDSSEFQDMIAEYNVEFFFKKPLNIDDLKKRLLDDLASRGIHIED